MVFELSRRSGRNRAGRDASVEARAGSNTLRAIRDVAGKAWNAPNTAIGLAYGLAGHGAGLIMNTHPQIRVGGNAIQFVNNPFGGVSAITLGNTTTYVRDPDEPGRPWLDEHGNPVADHEEQHTRQGELLGPLYLASNILGGLNAILRDPPSDDPWHGPSNWNEVGPMMNPPRPWPGRR